MPVSQSRSCKVKVFQETGTPQVMGLQASVPVDHGVPAEQIKQRSLFTTTGYRVHDRIALSGGLRVPHSLASTRSVVSNRPASSSSDLPSAYQHHADHVLHMDKSISAQKQVLMH